VVALKLEIGDGIAHIPAKKQERRGGIETLARSGGEPPASGGSRNAVVALKHDPRGDPHHHRTPKQERRGGIETYKKRAVGDLNGREAGTPWWH